jgi:hypothetical protein
VPQTVDHARRQLADGGDVPVAVQAGGGAQQRETWVGGGVGVGGAAWCSGAGEGDG